MWFHYSQNNSGGYFDFDKERKITHHMVFEAKDANEANILAEARGLYFDGCDNDRDCPCCGDRWYRAYGKGDEAPMVYGQTAQQYHDSMRWTDDDTMPMIYVFPLKGEVREYGFKKKKKKKVAKTKSKAKAKSKAKSKK